MGMTRGILIIGLSVISIAAALSAAQGDLDVVGLISNPRAFQDRPVTLTGVLRPGPHYGKLYQDADSFSKRHPDLKSYVELDGPRGTYAQSEKYYGAIVTVSGVYHHNCPPASSTLCFDHGGNGIIKVGYIGLLGYIDAAKFGRDRNTIEGRLLQVLEGGPDTSGLRVLIDQYIVAIETRDESRLAMLFVESERLEARAALSDHSSQDWWRVFAPEMRFHAGQMQSGINFALLHNSSPRPSYFLCFCRASSCERKWPTVIDDIYMTNVRDAYICRHVLLEGGRWRLSRAD